MSLQKLITQVESILSVDDLAGIKQCVKDSYSWLDASFNEAPVSQLVTGRAQFVDALLLHMWHLLSLDDVNDLALCAVGGYGRGHLQPYSDIDLLILSRKPLNPEVQEKVSRFITLLWDIRLDVGQSVRTIKETIKLAKDDISICLLYTSPSPRD